MFEGCGPRGDRLAAYSRCEGALEGGNELLPVRRQRISTTKEYELLRIGQPQCAARRKKRMCN